MEQPGSKLLPGEEINFGAPEDSDATPTSAEAVNLRYAEGSVRIVTEQARYPLPQIPVMAKSPDYRLDPEFQRRHRWDDDKKSRLIESFIINVPIPPIFLYEVGYAKFEVMDGLQRMTAISDFYENRFCLTGLEEWPELNGMTYQELPDSIRRGIDRRYLSSIVLLQETAKNDNEAQRLKQLVFERINSGGVKLSDQESRNAIYDGKMNRLCISLSRHPSLCKLWGIPEPDPAEVEGGPVRHEVRSDPRYSKMDDVELVLRFFAYRQRLKNQDGSLKSFLDDYLQKANFFSSDVLSALREIFSETILFVDELLGDEAFYLWRKRKTGWSWFQRPTTAVYDPLMYAASINLQRKAVILSKKANVKDALKELYEREYDQFQGRYTNRENLIARNALFISLFDGLAD